MKQRLRSDQGQSLVEFVLVMPLLFGLVFLIAYAGVGFSRRLEVTDAARVGVRAAAVARFRDENPCDAATTAAQAAVGGLTIHVDCEPAGGPYAPGDPFKVTVTTDLTVDFPIHVTTVIQSSANERLE